MILLDANLLLYAHIEEFPRHEAARRWLDACLTGRAPVGLPTASLLAFVRIASNGRVFERPVAPAVGAAQVRDWLRAPAAWTPRETERHWDLVRELLDDAPDRSTKLVTDAHLAALSIEHALTLCTTDRGFARFDGLRWENPLA